MTRKSQHVSLAAGIVALFLATTVTFSLGTAGAVVAAVGLFLAAVNILAGRSHDAAEASGVLAQALGSGGRLAASVVIVWISALLLSGFALLSDSLTILVIDEYGLPVNDARVTVDVGDRERHVRTTDGTAVVRYFPPFSSMTATISVTYRGETKIARASRPNGEGFDDITVRVFSGQTVVSVAHITARGLAIDGFLNGNLPPELAQRYPSLSVLRNDVYDAAKRFVDIYDIFDGDILAYERAEGAEGSERSAARSETTALNGADSSLASYMPRANRLRFPRTIYEDVGLDLSADIVGASLANPLPAGFRIQLMQADHWDSGDNASVDPETSARVQSTSPAAAQSASGIVSVRLEWLVGASELENVMRHARSVSAPGHRGSPDRTYVDFMIRNGAPRGLVGAEFHLDPRECGDADVEPHLMLTLPEPELRITILKNTSQYPLRINEILETSRSGGPLWRMDTQGRGPEVLRREFDVLSPGEALLVPRWMAVRAVHTDQEASMFVAGDTGLLAQFRLVPRHDQYTRVDERHWSRLRLMPYQLLIDASRVGVATASAQSEVLARQRQPGPMYAIGPVVDDLDYVVNGVRLRARPDTGEVISMIGGWEIGSCPFVFAHMPAGTALNVGTIITDRIGQSSAGRERIRLPDGVERVEIRELEDETSYIDQATLVVIREGRALRMIALDGDLSAEDGRYRILRRGDRLMLDFGYRRVNHDQVWLEVSGYYQPTTRSVRARR